MKRIIISLVLILLVVFSSICFADIGDKIGSFYSTDIKAYINDVPVKAYNIGGRTCVAIEEVTNGYSYNNDLRLLLVKSFAPDVLIKDDSVPSKKSIGKVLGSIYDTDIRAVIRYADFPSYNIGGKTCVAIEDVGKDREYSEVGGIYYWNPDERTIKLEIKMGTESTTGDRAKREEVINEMLNARVATIKERYDTDDYSFLYCTQPTPHGNSEFVVYFRNDGIEEYISSLLPAGYRTRHFAKVDIDKEKELVTLVVTAFEDYEYVFDMKNDQFLGL